MYESQDDMEVSTPSIPSPCSFFAFKITYLETHKKKKEVETPRNQVYDKWNTYNQVAFICRLHGLCSHAQLSYYYSSYTYLLTRYILLYVLFIFIFALFYVVCSINLKTLFFSFSPLCYVQLCSISKFILFTSLLYV